MNHFREVVTEREVVAPRPTQAREMRVPPPPALHRAAEPQVRHEEPRAVTPPVARQTVDERTVNQKKPEIDQPRPMQESRTQDDLGAQHSRRPHGAFEPEITRTPAEKQVLISRDVVVEKVQPRQEQAWATVQADSPTPSAATTPQFPAPTPERRPERHLPAMKAEPQIRTHEFPVAPARVPYVQPALPHTEIAAPGIHVTIGKVTVQATLPAAAPVHAPARAPAHSGPRLTLERYLDRRGGRP